MNEKEKLFKTIRYVIVIITVLFLLSLLGVFVLGFLGAFIP